MSLPVVSRGDIYWIQFAAGIGGEIAKTRPAIVGSNDVANRVMNRIQVVPLTSRVVSLYPGEADVHVNGVLNKALASQLSTVAKERIRSFVGTLSDDDLRREERAIRQQLALGS